MAVEMRKLAGLYRPGPADRPQDGPQDRSQDRFISAGRIFNPPPGVSPERLLADLAQDPARLETLESDLALAHYDAAQDRVTLVRDACGLTPLYYARCGEGWAFGLTLEALFEILGGPPPLNEAAFYDFAATHYRHIFRDPSRTFHQGVLQAPAGCSVSLKGQEAHVRRWFKLEFQPALALLSPQEASELYVAGLDENVRLRLEALEGRNCAFTVSSGMDSASVACLAARRLNRPLDAWFMAYRDQSGSPYDETAGVEALVQSLGWRLHRLDLGAPDLLSETATLMKKTLAPVATVTWLAHYVMARQAAEEGVEFLFSGLGGDESLAGEFEHFFVFFADLQAAGQDELLAQETQAWIRLHDHPVFKKTTEVRDEWFARNLDFQTGEIRVDQRRYAAHREFFDPGWVEAQEAAAPPPPMPRPFPYFLSNRLYQEMTYETSPPTLWSEALSSRAAGVKGVFPMTSPKLLALALSLPGTFKYENGLTKMLLRRAMKGILPDSSRLNPVKTGFNAPLDLWLQEKKLNDDCRALLNSAPFKNLGWLRPGAADRMLDEHLQGRRNLMMLLWPLISTAIFLDQGLAGGA
ncbi:MAG: hypothetical protein LBU12_06255 [Deltaproteobacteria bacterium]|jgi:asparagine synthase (glutamine-hydrolysing)|nr:hypothetical protein [Deltaproteobacteria bacterium]